MAIRSAGPLDPDWPSAAGGKASLVVAEDDIDFAMLLADRLALSGYLVTTAEDGELAIDMMTLDEPSALIVDLHLPKRDGFEVAAHARHLRGRAFPIIAITGDRSALTTARARAAGCDLVIAKPFHIDVLCDSIEKLRARSLPS